MRHGGIDGALHPRLPAEIARPPGAYPGREVSTIFFGGGTPSLMQPSTVQAILDSHRQALDRRARRGSHAGSQSHQRRRPRFRGYRTAGVNRVSLGVQALDDVALKELGRLHSAREALEAVAVARSIFERYSFDLIYARPRQTPQAWAEELQRAIAEAAEHLSLYQLTIEPETPFYALHKSGKLVIPDEDCGARFTTSRRKFARAPACPLMRFRTTPAGRGMPAQPRLLARA